MTSRKRQSPPLPIILNDDTRSWWIDQGKLAERVFQAKREDRLAPTTMSDAEWRSLLHGLSISCRKTVEFLGRYKATLPFEGEKPEKPGEVKRVLSGPEWEKLRQDPYFGFMYLLDSLHAFWWGAERSVGGVDKGLEFFAQYCDIMRARSPGRRPDQALIKLIRAKLVAWLAAHGDRSICYWNDYTGFEGAFLDEMEQTLQRLDYEYQSRDALAQRIKAVRKRVVVYASVEEAGRAMTEREQRSRHQGDGPARI